MKENRHTREDLKQMQSLPLEAKIQMTKQRIKDWYENWETVEAYNTNTGKTRYFAFDSRDKFKEPPLRKNEIIKSQTFGGVYVTFSGGKDSTVLKHIVDGMYDDVTSVFINTGLEYPEIQRFAQAQKNVITVRPEMRFDEVIKKYGYPIISKEISRNLHYINSEWAKVYVDGEKSINGKLSRYNFDKWKYLKDADFLIGDNCCNVMKKKPSHQYAHKVGKVPIIGTMADESLMRLEHWIIEGCNAWDNKSPTSKPLSFWTERDIYEYIIKYDVEICSVYGEVIGIDEDGSEYGKQALKWLIANYGTIPPSIKLKTTGANRTGCIFCAFGAHRESEPNRFQRLKQTHPAQYKYCINGGAYDEDGKWKPNKEGLGMAHVLDAIGVKYE